MDSDVEMDYQPFIIFRLQNTKMEHMQAHLLNH